MPQGVRVSQADVTKRYQRAAFSRQAVHFVLEQLQLTMVVECWLCGEYPASAPDAPVLCPRQATNCVRR